jgi:hypothetical protein
MPADSFYGSGLFGQRLVVIPSQRLVIVRLGATVDPPDFDIQGLLRLVRDVIAAGPPPASAAAAGKSLRDVEGRGGAPALR